MNRNELRDKLLEVCIADRYYRDFHTPETAKERNTLFEEILNANDKLLNKDNK